MLTLLGPGRRFTLPKDSDKNVLFLGGGIGVTPYRSMARFATDSRLPHKTTLLYSSRTPEEIVYRKEWEAMARSNPNLKVVYTITRPEASTETWSGHVGHIDGQFILENVEDLKNSHFYICGPPSLITGLAYALIGLGADRRAIQVEGFPGYDQA